jgi:hypothetical protein
LLDLNLKDHFALNRRGRRIALIGNPLPASELPCDILAILCRAAAEWNLPSSATWERVDFGGKRKADDTSTRTREFP